MNKPHPEQLSSKPLSPAKSGQAGRIGLLLALLSIPLFAFSQAPGSGNGFLLVTSNMPGVKYQIDGYDQPEVEYLPLPPGSYEVRAYGQNPVTGDFEQTRQVEIRTAATTQERFDFPHGTLTLTSNEIYARFLISGLSLGKVKNLPLPPGTYTVEAVLPKAVTGFGEYRVTRSVTVEDGVQLEQPLDFSYGTVTITSSLKNTKYLIDGVAKSKVNKLKLPVGEHSYTALPPAPYNPISGSFAVALGEDLPLELEFAKTRLISDAEKRREFAWRYGLMPAGVLEANHYFGLGGTGQSGYAPLSNGLSVSGLRFRAINLWDKEFNQPYSAQYPAFMVGASLLDQAVFTWEQDGWESGILLDIGSLAVGGVHLSPGGLLHGQLELIGHFSYQKPLVSEIGYYSYVTSFKEGDSRSYSFWDYQWGGEARVQFGIRLAQYNYLNLHLGTRYQQKLQGNWYSNNDIAAWMTEEGPLPEPDWPAGVPARNAAFEGLSFYAGIGFETSLIPSLLGLALDKSEKDRGEDLLD
ncbi:MAG: hypothetical protein LHW57_06790 [Candidatus Cloacimonetes bacterium]|nr:hypothetical protein [Candidatus Cloacimonadota bacterium]